MAAFSSLRLSIAVLSVLITTSEGYPGKPAGTAELNVTFHQKPSQVFSNRPIQGSCAGSTKENQSLVLEIIGKGASPQNRRVLARYKLETHIDVEKDVNAIVVNGNPEKIVDPSSGYTRRGMLFKICPQRNLHGAEIFCSVVDGNGETVSHIGLPNPIEYREFTPTVTKLKVHYHIMPNIAIVGDDLTVSCAAKLPDSGKLVIQLSIARGNLFWDFSADGKSYTSPENHDVQAYLRVKKAGPYLSAALVVRVSPLLENGIFRCFPADEKGQLAYFGDTASKSLHVKSYQRKPELSIDSKIVNLQGRKELFVNASCHDAIGSDFPLHMSLKTDPVTYTYVTTQSAEGKATEFRNSGSSQMDIKNFVEFTKEHTLKPKTVMVRMYAYLTVPSNASLFCRVHDLQVCRKLHSDEVPIKLLAPKEKYKNPISIISATVILVTVIVFLLFLYNFFNQDTYDFE
ncbi:hypothetical protein RRG08_064317 [Elysia crispata]|uniref:Ig-like domain-containing protein n=1 Tax=Elysia crispata TaxID=231223 RepID=A0AAE1B328_9GAST|nr:hypothetical protein RRG08_064317 [Elysia crispata]